MIAPSDKYEGKWVLDMTVDGIKRDRFFVSEKQAKSVIRVQNRPERFVVVDIAPEKGARFVFASDNPQWLTSTFGKDKSIKPLSVTAESLQPVNPPRDKGYTAQEFTEQDLPF